MADRSEGRMLEDLVGEGDVVLLTTAGVDHRARSQEH